MPYASYRCCGNQSSRRDAFFSFIESEANLRHKLLDYNLKIVIEIQQVNTQSLISVELTS